MDKPWILDLFAGAGGAGEGYRRAGFHVVSVDIEPQPHNPHECYQADALEVLATLLARKEWQGYRLEDFQAIHASPPCQEYSATRHFRKIAGMPTYTKAMLIEPVYTLLRRSPIPWILENVDGAPMPDAIELCGTMFNLPLRRHRLFSGSFILFAPRSCQHGHFPGFYNVVGDCVKSYGTLRSERTFMEKGKPRRREGKPGKAAGVKALGIDWMTLPEMSQAIPPAYTAWLGMQLMNVILNARQGVA